MLDGAKLFLLSVSHSIIQIVCLSSQSRIDCCSPARRCCNFLDKQETRPTQVRLKKRFQSKPPRLPSACKEVTSAADANDMLAAQTMQEYLGTSSSTHTLFPHPQHLFPIRIHQSTSYTQPDRRQPHLPHIVFLALARGPKNEAAWRSQTKPHPSVTSS